MANTFQDQANERFDKATAFLNSSRSLLRNDLIYVSALADAVSAIKNMLQGYLFTQIGEKGPGAAPQSWQEASASGSMPDLLRASTEAGLRLPNLLGPRISQLNRDRNARTHDNPRRLIDYARAQEAISLAEEVRRSIRAALGAAPAPAASAPAPVAAVAAPAAPAPVAAPAPRAPVAPLPAPAATLGGDEPDESDEDVSPAPLRRVSGWRRFTRALGRIAAVLLLLLVGLAAGVGVMIPVASGNAPSWLSFATRLLPTPSAAMTQTPAPTATPSSGPIIVGVVTVSEPVCSVGGASFQLHNTGTEPVRWSVGSPGGTSAVFALAAGETPQVTLFGTLPSASAVTIYSSGKQPVVLTTDGGAVQLTLPAC
ncbi:MAG TPA: hypothetical protein VFQ32_15315 [Ktedonobacterales bacterium]|nr:hypothetical protein [Ktedonobacterales bacterium]